MAFGRSEQSGKWSGKKKLVLALGIVGFFLVILGGTAFAAYRYDRATIERIMPGIKVAGIDVSDMTKAEAEKAIHEKIDRQLSRPLTVKVGEENWKTSSAELGTKPDVGVAVNKALGVANSYSWMSRVYHRIADKPVTASFELGYRLDFSTVEQYVATIAGEVGRPAVNGGFSIAGNDLEYQNSKPGRELKARVGIFRLRAALRAHRASVALPLETIEPSVGDADKQYTIAIRLSQNKLYLYKGRDVVKTYSVATGSPGFPTPEGSFEIEGKDENPSWTNPDPNGWGSSMPAFIPGGAGSPLGTRALYLNAPGIRIHGTSDTGSIGTYASHGCIRMLMPEVEQLYDIVDIGTPVLILK
ncbi:MAG: L,D-transpeptidase family protein [Actinomycetota bacterium]